MDLEGVENQAKDESSSTEKDGSSPIVEEYGRERDPVPNTSNQPIRHEIEEEINPPPPYSSDYLVVQRFEKLEAVIENIKNQRYADYETLRDAITERVDSLAVALQQLTERFEEQIDALAEKVDNFSQELTERVANLAQQLTERADNLEQQLIERVDDNAENANEQNLLLDIASLVDHASIAAILPHLLTRIEGLELRRTTLGNEEISAKDLCRSVYTQLNSSLVAFLTFIAAMSALTSSGVLKDSFWALYVILLLFLVAYVTLAAFVHTMAQNDCRTFEWKLIVIERSRSSLINDVDQLDGVLGEVNSIHKNLRGTNAVNDEVGRLNTAKLDTAIDKVSILKSTLEHGQFKEDVARYLVVCLVVSLVCLIVFLGWMFIIHWDDAQKRLHGFTLGPMNDGLHMPT